MPNIDDLRRILKRIDGRSYNAYHEIRGEFELDAFRLCVDHVQGDPFASPSKLRLRVDQSFAQLPAELFDNSVRRLAFEDHLARRVRRAARDCARSGGERKGSGKSGVVLVDAGGQEVLKRTAIVVTSEWVEVRLEVGLPANGRKILGREAEKLLCERLFAIARASLVQPPADAARHFVDCIENQEAIRDQLSSLGLIAFVADGSRLPRESGASDRPLAAQNVVAFESPESLRVEIDLLRPVEIGGALRSSIEGLGVREGVTLIVGGGYHGKSTLLDAIERGVYPHIPGDGREWVVSDRGLVKIRAEDGRRVEKVDIDAFIRNLPQGRSTTAFESDDASGSTSQAASLVEALEAGASGLLLDEDTSATNFMVRDARMQALIQKQHEPITPFVERVRELHESLSVSTVLVMGGCGDYFDTADTVIALRDYRPLDVTEEARAIAANASSSRQMEAANPVGEVAQRIPLQGSIDASRGRKRVSIRTRSLDQIEFGREEIDLRGVEQLVDRSQTRAIAAAIHFAAERLIDCDRTLRDVLDRLDTLFDERGLDELDPFYRVGQHPGNYPRPRRFELAAAINRLRSLQVRQSEKRDSQRGPTRKTARR
ncbi:MAG: ABC-ATPase domain-containing protein [Deltaproteobacteria bacterium]|jgi:predicted ABC-class ATPase|nr:ABC-ATPase domain-containing protein [Deltaproteobacteria bacterium]